MRCACTRSKSPRPPKTCPWLRFAPIRGLAANASLSPECIEDFKEIDESTALQSILDHIAKRPPLGLDFSEETEAELADIAGGYQRRAGALIQADRPETEEPPDQALEARVPGFRSLAVAASRAPRRLLKAPTQAR